MRCNKPSLCLIKYHSVKTCRRVEVSPHILNLHPRCICKEILNAAVQCNRYCLHLISFVKNSFAGSINAHQHQVGRKNAKRNVLAKVCAANGVNIYTLVFFFFLILGRWLYVDT
jgi:hypothetical protein